MATQKKIVEMITLIKNLFPFYAKDSNVEMLVKTWSILLNDYPDKTVEVAFMNCLKSAKMPPVPADVIEHIKAIQETAEESTEELWVVYIKALEKAGDLMQYFHYDFIPEGKTKTQGQTARENFQKLWDDLPDRLKAYLENKSILMQNAKTFNDKDLIFERTRFDKIMPTLKKRDTYATISKQINGEQLMIDKKVKT